MVTYERYETQEIPKQPESYERAGLERDFARRAEVEEITAASVEETASAASDVPGEHALEGIQELDPDRWSASPGMMRWIIVSGWEVGCLRKRSGNTRRGGQRDWRIRGGIPSRARA